MVFESVFQTVMMHAVVSEDPHCLAGVSCGLQSSLRSTEGEAVGCEARPGIQNLVTLGWVSGGGNMEKQTDGIPMWKHKRK